MKAVKKSHSARKTRRAATHITRPAGAKAFKRTFKHVFGMKPLPEHYDAVKLGEVFA